MFRFILRDDPAEEGSPAALDWSKRLGIDSNQRSNQTLITRQTYNNTVSLTDFLHFAVGFHFQRGASNGATPPKA